MKHYKTKEWKGENLVEHLLYHRGHKTKKEIDSFLNPDYVRDQHDPFLLKDIEKAVSRILLAIEKKQKIVIYSDYDTDGIPGAVVLHDFFKKINFDNFINYIPHRHDEGFGLHKDAITEFKKNKFDLVVTIDCGISDIESVKHAKDLGIDVIITDHHLPHELPEAFAIINPKQKDCLYPEKMLCGSGVVFKLVQALIKKGNFDIPLGWEKWLLDMVSVATLSDMVPLVGENRVFAKYGLMVLRKSPRLGLRTLLKKTKTEQRYLNEDDIGFTIGPRINAASRMGVPMDAFKMLSVTDLDEAVNVVNHLDKINNERKILVANMVKEAKKTIATRYASDLPKVLVLGNPEWKPSLLGLVANTLAEEYVKPVYLWGKDGDGTIKGSCRSDGETDLVNLMRMLPDNTFLQFGGHAYSGGFSVENKKIHTLGDLLNKAFLELNKEEIKQEYWVDATLSLDDVSKDTFEKIDSLAPFGMKNEKPIFMFQNVTAESIRLFGKEKNHLELSFKNRNGRIKAISFFSKPEDWNLVEGKPINLIANIEKSMFLNKEEIRLRIVDII